jgi:hypothetical protein
MAAPLLRPLPARADEPGPVGRVDRQAGSVVAIRDRQPRVLIVGASVFADDSLRTSADGKARIVFASGLVLVVGPGSVVELQRYFADQGGGIEVLMRLVTGIVRMIDEAVTGPVELQVETREAIASVRSTDWICIRGAEGTAVFTARGSVEVAGEGGAAVTLTAGQGTDVAPGAVPTAPKIWGAGRRDQALALTTL